MKKFLVLISCFLATLFVSGQSLPDQSDPDTNQMHLNEILNKWHRDAAAGNHAAYIGAMSSDGVFIGTDPSERWTTAEFSSWSKPFFEKKRTWNFRAISRNIFIGDDGMVAWFDELLETQMGICRGSGVLQKRDGTWKIEQYVLSASIPNDIMKQVTAMKSGNDSSLILKGIFDKYGMTGTILIFDPLSGRSFGYNPARWDSGYLPASTFKIPNTLIGMETGVIKPNHVFKWKREERRLPQWKQDLKLRDAFQVSCVPCYQEVARQIGPARMKSSLEKINYPGMDVQPENIDRFWLEGNSRITPRQQVDFLKRLFEENLPLKSSVMKEMKSIMIQETTPEYALSGKTGWAIRNGNNYGWFVGWIEAKGKVYFIATLVEPKSQDKVDDFALARKTVTMEVLRWLGKINGEIGK